MKPCLYHGWCGLNSDADSDSLCILHSRNPEKDQIAFREALSHHRKKKGDVFNHFVFPGDTDFALTHFERADFSFATFTGDTNFLLTHFKKADFFSANFIGKSVFRYTTFEGEANFKGATFEQDVDFREAIFEKEAIFTETTFQQVGGFVGAIFEHQADFKNVKFRSWVHFGRAEFKETANFCEAEFEGDADFLWAIFKKEAAFLNSKFVKAYFLKATFEQDADFRNAIIKEAVTFLEATFKELANFSGAILTNVFFSCVNFLFNAYFEHTAFKGDFVSFNGSSFLGKTRFTGWRSGHQCVPIFSGIHVDFRDVTIIPPGIVIFSIIDLSQCEFLDTDLRKVQIIDAIWAQTGGPFRKSICVYDEIATRHTEATCPWDKIERLYQQLKKDCEERGDHHHAGDFHYREKEIQRRNPNTTFLNRFFLSVYWLLSGYGEQYLRPLVWTIGLFVASTFGYLFGGLLPKGGGQQLSLMENRIGSMLPTTAFELWLS